MRIPIHKSDLDEGRFSKIARALQKLWPSGAMTLMQSQNRLAGLLGYRDLHDLQARAGDDYRPPDGHLSRANILNSIAWRLFRRHGVALTMAFEIAEKLHLKTLEIDALTPEAVIDRAREKQIQAGRLVVIDEAWSLWNPQWDTKTPRLLEANLPGYRYAVLPDRRLFRWSQLEALLGRLPVDYVEELDQEPRYERLATSEAKERAFVFDEIFPQACGPLTAGIKEAEIRPKGFNIIWLFTGAGDCIGRVLSNRSLGGIIPIIFDAADDSIFDDIGALLCGETLTPPVADQRLDDAPVFTVSWFSNGNDLAADLRFLPGKVRMSGKTDPQNLIPLPGHIRYRIVDGRPALLGKSFVEQGQVYLRNQPWVSTDDVPECLSPLSSVDASVIDEADRLYLDSSGAVPAAAIAFHEGVVLRLNQLFADAAARLVTPAGLWRLSDLLMSLVFPADFDVYCRALIESDLPLRYEGDEEDSPNLVEERERELDELTWKGRGIKEVLPALSEFDNASLGYVLLSLDGEYPGSRFAGLVRPPKDDDLAGKTFLMAGLVFHAVCCASKAKAPVRAFNAEVLRVAVDRAIQGLDEPSSIPAVDGALSAFRMRLDEHTKFARELEEWRRSDDAIQQLRDKGQYLYVGDSIFREKPEGIAEWVTRATSRSRKFRTVVNHE